MSVLPATVLFRNCPILDPTNYFCPYYEMISLRRMGPFPVDGHILYLYPGYCPSPIFVSQLGQKSSPKDTGTTNEDAGPTDNVSSGSFVLPVGDKKTRQESECMLDFVYCNSIYSC